MQTSKDLPKVVVVPAGKGMPAGRMLVPAPVDVDAVMKKVPRGKLVTTTEIRQVLAAEAGVSQACPLTTGIFSWIAAHAAEEAADAGAKRITPWWRTLKPKGELNPRFPGGLDALRTRLESEGHTVVLKGQRMFVKDYEKKLAKIAR